MRLLWKLAGLLAAALGLVGLVLPIMPSVPFMILAAFCFSRSSPRLHTYLVTHPVYGPHIRDWHERGAIRPDAKWLATVSMIGSVTLSFILGMPPHVIAAQAAVLTLAMAFIWSRPSE